VLLKLRKEEQARKALASEMLAAAQLQNEAQQRCNQLETRLRKVESGFALEAEDLEQKTAQKLKKAEVESELKFGELEASYKSRLEQLELEKAKLQAKVDKGGSGPQSEQLRQEVVALTKKKDYLKKQLDLCESKRSEAEESCKKAEEEVAHEIAKNTKLFEAKKELSEKFSAAVTSEGSSSEMEGLKQQLHDQAELIKEMETRHKDKLKKATVEMSQFTKKQVDAKNEEVENLKADLERAQEQLGAKEEVETKKADEAMSEELDKLRREKKKAEGRARELQGEQRVIKLEYESQIDKLQSRLRRMKERVGEQDADEARAEAQTLRTEVLRLRTVVSNVLKEKAILEESLEKHKKLGAEEQIDKLRQETQRLQQFAKKAEEDMQEAKSMRQEVEVKTKETEREMEENFWKVAERKLAATWSSPHSAKNYFPSRRKSKDPTGKVESESGSEPGTPTLAEAEAEADGVSTPSKSDGGSPKSGSGSSPERAASPKPIPTRGA